MIEPRILIVDADKCYRRVCVDYFELRGFSMSEAASAQSAVAICEANIPAIIILDLQLVGHSGVEFLYELRSYTEWQNTPVLLLSSVPESSLSGLDAGWVLLGITKYLYKPETSLKKLHAHVDEIMAVHV